MFDGRLLQMDKRYTNLKQTQKKKLISGLMKRFEPFIKSMVIFQLLMRRMLSRIIEKPEQIEEWRRK